MKDYQANIQSPHFDHILSGEKVFEVRLNKGKWKEIEKGDKILIDNQPGTERTVLVEVIDKKKYKSFREMFEEEGLEKIVPHAKDVEQAVSECRAYYTEEDEKEYGVVAVQIRVI